MSNCVLMSYFSIPGPLSMSSSPTSPRTSVSQSVYRLPGLLTARLSLVASRMTSSGCGPSCHKPPTAIPLPSYFAPPEKCTVHCWLAGRRQLAGRRLYVRFGDVSLFRAPLHVASKSKLCFAHSLALIAVSRDLGNAARYTTHNRLLTIRSTECSLRPRMQCIVP